MSQLQATAMLDALKSHLKQHGLTYRDLAKRCELTETTVKRLLNRPHIPLDQLMELCAAADTSMAALIIAADSSLDNQVNPMSTDQADAIFEQPALISVLTAVQFGNRSVAGIAKSFDINLASAYLYIRQLEVLGCLTLQGDDIGLKFPLQSSLNPKMHPESTRMIMEKILKYVGKTCMDPPEEMKTDKGLIYAEIMLLNDEDYQAYVADVLKLQEQYNKISLNNVKYPKPDSKPREQFLMVMPKQITEDFPVPNLVDDVAGVTETDTEQ